MTAGGQLTGTAMADKVMVRLLKQAALHAGLDPARFFGHFLRRSLLADADRRQLQLADLVRHSRHKSVETAPYLEMGNLRRSNITEGAYGRRSDMNECEDTATPQLTDGRSASVPSRQPSLIALYADRQPTTRCYLTRCDFAAPRSVCSDVT